MNNNETVARLTQAIDVSLKRLAEAVDEQRASDEVRRHLDLMARFPRYSWRNCILIALQMESASLVAGFRQWKRLGRNVKKGEKAIRIMAPCPIRMEMAGEATDTEDQHNDEIVYFKTACVFDVSQTEGKELPMCTLSAMEGDATELLRRLEEAAVGRGITVRYAMLPDGVFGVSEGGSIRITANHSTAQQAKTLSHEIAHEWMHRTASGAVDANVQRKTKELEAEAVAYVVYRHFGLNAQLRASQYIALWEGDATALAASFTRISRTARRLIEAVEAVEERPLKAAA